MNYTEIHEILRSRLSPARLDHSFHVAETAALLAPRFGVSPQEARIAGLLHDLCREESVDSLLQLAGKFGIVIDDIERVEPLLLHGAVGAALAADMFEIRTPAVLEAITYHITGAAGVGPLARLIFVADFIEPGRQFPIAGKLRQEAENLTPEELLLRVYEHTMMYVIKRGYLLHPRTVEGWNALVLEMKGV